MLAEILQPEIAVRELDEQLFSALPSDAQPASFDRWVSVYDTIVAHDLFSRLVWSTSNREYFAFARAAAESGVGWLMDIGGGSCLWSAQTYAATDRAVAVVDRSLAMLRAGRERLRRAAGGLPRNVAFLQADIYDLPLCEGCSETTLSMGLLHILEDLPSALAALRRITQPAGRIFASSLVRGPRVGNAGLRWLRFVGQIAPPRGARELEDFLRSGLGSDLQLRSHGSWMFARA